MNSCIYEGQVRHRRFTPHQHEFDYSLFLMYVDLDELPALFESFWLWSDRRFNMAWLKRKDHMGDSRLPLIDCVRDRIHEATGIQAKGPIRLLTHFRYFGFGFNPVSFYYCFNEQDTEIETVVCEVNNTPWGEQHVYVLSELDNRGQGALKIYHRAKEFHVSPFMPMDIDYNWRFNTPDDRLNVHMENYHNQRKIFDATLMLKKSPITSYHLARVLIQFPLVTVKVVAGIYFEAMRLWLKKIPFYSHPDNNKEEPEEASKL